jgi:hypothetical protein
MHWIPPNTRARLLWYGNFLIILPLILPISLQDKALKEAREIRIIPVES